MELTYVVVQNNGRDQVVFEGTLIECGDYFKSNPQCKLKLLTAEQWQNKLIPDLTDWHEKE